MRGIWRLLVFRVFRHLALSLKNWLYKPPEVRGKKKVKIARFKYVVSIL
jgi:hypothetical protein